ncbi:MAG: hypothetical protein IPP74_00160 [Alphaproteobacteria bacterium]|nr:hypothetical protein [Alphaproteobacteria bacterium]
MHKKRFIQLLSVASLLVSGCTALNHAHDQSILIITPDAEGAKCKLTDRKGNEWKLMRTPGNITVERGHPPMSVICTKTGYHTLVEMVDANPYESDYNDLVQGVTGLTKDPFGQVTDKYPYKLTFYLEPLTFASEVDKKRWLANRDFAKQQQATEQAILRKDYEKQQEERRKNSLFQFNNSEPEGKPLADREVPVISGQIIPLDFQDTDTMITTIDNHTR